MPFLRECAACGGAHPAKFRGDCRSDANRYEITDDSLIVWGLSGVLTLRRPGVSALSASFYRDAAKNAARCLKYALRDGDARGLRSNRLWRAYCLALVKAIEAGEVRFEAREG